MAAELFKSNANNGDRDRRPPEFGSHTPSPGAGDRSGCITALPLAEAACGNSAKSPRLAAAGVAKTTDRLGPVIANGFDRAPLFRVFAVSLFLG